MRKMITALLIIAAQVCFAQTPTSAAANAPVASIADSLFFNLKYEAAIPAYMDFIAKNANPPLSAFARLAFSNHYSGHYDEALKSYDVVLSKKPGMPMKASLYSRMSMTWSVKKK